MMDEDDKRTRKFYFDLTIGIDTFIYNNLQKLLTYKTRKEGIWEKTFNIRNRFFFN